MTLIARFTSARSSTPWRRSAWASFAVAMRSVRGLLVHAAGTDHARGLRGYFFFFDPDLDRDRVLRVRVLDRALLFFFAADLRRDDVPLRDARFFGTLPPSRRASDSPMAIACLRLFTFLPLRPLFSVPALRSFMALRTFDWAFLP
jgi:hypothetical protein